MSSNLFPRIYVASLSDYNAGILHGAWIECDGKSGDELREEVDAMLAASPTAAREGSPAEEFAIHDFDDFGGIALSEFESLDAVAQLAELIGAYGPAFAAWRGNGMCDGLNPEEWGDRFQDDFAGEFDSLADYAAELLEESGELSSVPDSLRCYIDFESYGRDLQLGGAVWTSDADNGGVYIFRNY